MLLLAALVTIFLTVSSSSCSKEEKNPAPDLSKGYPDAFTNKMSPKKLAALKKQEQPYTRDRTHLH